VLASAMVLVMVLAVMASAQPEPIKADHREERTVAIGPSYRSFPGFEEVGSKEQCSEEQLSKWRAYIQWLRNGGADITKVDIQPRCSDRGWMYFKVFARKSIRQNEPVFSIPDRLVLDSNKADAWFDDTGIGAVNELPSPFLALALFMVNELVTPESPFRPWLDTLDVSMDGSPLLWIDDDDAIDTLDETRLVDFAKAFHEQVTGEYELLTRRMFAQYPNIFPPELFTFERFRFARAYVFAYARDQHFQKETRPSDEDAAAEAAAAELGGDYQPHKEPETIMRVSLVPLWDSLATNYSSVLRLPMLRDGGFDLVALEEPDGKWAVSVGALVTRQPLRLDFSDFDTVLLTGKLPAITHGRLEIASTRLNTNYLQPIGRQILQLREEDKMPFDVERMNLRMGVFDYDTASLFRRTAGLGLPEAEQVDAGVTALIQVLEAWSSEYISSLEQDADMLLKQIPRATTEAQRHILDALRIRMIDKMLINDHIARGKQLLKHEIILREVPNDEPSPSATKAKEPEEADDDDDQEPVLKASQKQNRTQQGMHDEL